MRGCSGTAAAAGRPLQRRLIRPAGLHALCELGCALATDAGQAHAGVQRGPWPGAAVSPRWEGACRAPRAMSMLVMPRGTNWPCDDAARDLLPCRPSAAQQGARSRGAPAHSVVHSTSCIAGSTRAAAMHSPGAVGGGPVAAAAAPVERGAARQPAAAASGQSSGGSSTRCR